jgi:hypothetical protein
VNYYSNIYWHFTGSPKNIDWKNINSPKDILAHGKPKTDDDAFEILKLILESKILKASSHEKIDWRFNTQSFCCVTDIPLQSLHEHTKYYGNIAIGFNHKKIHSDFNPVFYIPRNKLKTKLDSVTLPNEVNLGWLGSLRFKDDGTYETIRTPFMNTYLGSQIDERELGSYIFEYFKITDFSDKSEETFYREREWRKLKDFNFEYEDISSVIVPSKYVEAASETLLNINAKNITILNWEFLKKV